MSDLSRGELSLQLPTGISPLEWSLLWCCRGDGRGLDWGLPLGLGDLLAEQKLRHSWSLCNISAFIALSYITTAQLPWHDTTRNKPCTSEKVNTKDFLNCLLLHPPPAPFLPYQPAQNICHETAIFTNIPANKMSGGKYTEAHWRVGVWERKGEMERVHPCDMLWQSQCRSTACCTITFSVLIICFCTVNENKSFSPHFWKLKQLTLHPLQKTHTHFP